jgi:hypothetical protein
MRVEVVLPWELVKNDLTAQALELLLITNRDESIMEEIELLLRRRRLTEGFRDIVTQK